jgi:hypothetical protein
LGDLLTPKGNEVHRIKRRASLINTHRIDRTYEDPNEPDPRLVSHCGGLTDSTGLFRVMQQVQPEKISNPGAQGTCAVTFDSPEYGANSNSMGALCLLKAVRIHGLRGRVCFYWLSTSKMFGQFVGMPQRQATTFYLSVPSGVANAYGARVTINYTAPYGFFSCSDFPFNHDSPIRGEAIVTRKIAGAANSMFSVDCLRAHSESEGHVIRAARKQCSKKSRFVDPSYIATNRLPQPDKERCSPDRRLKPLLKKLKLSGGNTGAIKSERRPLTSAMRVIACAPKFRQPLPVRPQRSRNSTKAGDLQVRAEGPPAESTQCTDVGELTNYCVFPMSGDFEWGTVDVDEKESGRRRLIKLMVPIAVGSYFAPRIQAHTVERAAPEEASGCFAVSMDEVASAGQCTRRKWPARSRTQLATRQHSREMP